jgi:NAD(P)-dependent dehydrogenase (short-subunit alcohol dehydrogenase family)
LNLYECIVVRAQCVSVPAEEGRASHGRVAIVTGGGSGIGAEISRQLAKEGAAVVVTGIKLEAAQSVVEEIFAAGGKAAAFEQNTANWEDSEAAVAFAKETFGALHLAVNNAGIGAAPQTIGDYDIAAWDRVRAVDLDGVFYGLKFQLPAIVEAGAALTLFLLSEAASFVSGSYHLVDGGYSAH